MTSREVFAEMMDVRPDEITTITYYPHLAKYKITTADRQQWFTDLEVVEFKSNA